TKMNAKMVGFLGLLLLLLPAMALAQNSCATPTVVPASGEKTDFDFVAGGGTNVYQFDVKPNRSYSVEVRQDYDPVNTDLTAGGGSVTVFSDTGCLATVTGLTDTTAAEPALPANSTRVSFVTPSSVPNGSYRVQVVNGNAAAGRYISVKVAETT